MSENSISPKHSKFIFGVKYCYLAVFFILVAGIFYPFITDDETAMERFVYGVLSLFVGLGGGILVYKGITISGKKAILIAVGFSLIAISLYFIHELSTSLFNF